MPLKGKQLAADAVADAGGVQMLGVGLNVDIGNIHTPQQIYTVPAGKTLYITQVLVEGVNQAAVAGTAVIALNSGGTNPLTNAVTGPANGFLVQSTFNLTNYAPVAAGQTVWGARLAGGSAQHLVNIYVMGFLR